MVAACPAGLVDEPFAPRFTRVVGGLADAVAGVIDTGEGVHLGGELGDVNPLGAGARAARSASRMRGFVEVDTADAGGAQPDAVGSSSWTPSPRDPVSTQSRAVANRSTTPASRDTIGGSIHGLAIGQTMQGLQRDHSRHHIGRHAGPTLTTREQIREHLIGEQLAPMRRQERKNAVRLQKMARN